jgi:hypothetical protein
MSSTAAQDGTLPATVGEYAASVRGHLADLPAEQVDDLTDGLEADLADALADTTADPDGAAPDLVRRFGPPAEYALELRSAAGLPEPGPASPPLGPTGARRLVDAVRRGARAVGAALDRQPWWPAVRDFLVALRPAWWLLRAWSLYQVLMTVSGTRSGWVPYDLQTVLVFAALAVVSVQWGRGSWLPRRLTWLPAAVGVVAVVLLPAAVAEARYGGNGGAGGSGYAEAYVYPDVPQQDGVWVDGMQVSNLFVYDRAGNPLSDVQVYDDRGRAVQTVVDDGWGAYELPGVSGPWGFVPATDEDDRRRWNVYPLLGAPYEEFDWDNPEGLQRPEQLLTSDPRVPPPPFAKAPAVVQRDAEQAAPEGSSPGQDESPAPAGSPVPSPEPTAAP